MTSEVFYNPIIEHMFVFVYWHLAIKKHPIFLQGV